MKRFIAGLILSLALFLLPHSVYADDACYYPSPVVEVTPTPVATPSATTEPTMIPVPALSSTGNPPTFAGSTTNAPAAVTCTIPFAAPILQGYSLANGVETYQWWPSTASNIVKQSVVYGYEIGNPIYGVASLSPDVTSIDINGLDINRTSYAQIWSWDSNGCVAKSNWLN